MFVWCRLILANKIDLCFHFIIAFCHLVYMWRWLNRYPGQIVGNNDTFACHKKIVNEHLNNCVLNVCVQIGSLSKFFMLKSGTGGCGQYEYIHNYMKCSPKHASSLLLR